MPLSEAVSRVMSGELCGRQDRAGPFDGVAEAARLTLALRLMKSNDSSAGKVPDFFRLFQNWRMK